MSHRDWESSWQLGNTPWDAGGPAAQLEALIRADDLPAGRALVPGCGSGYDVLALAGAGRSTLGLEIAPSAIARFRDLRSESGQSVEQADVGVFRPNV